MGKKDERYFTLSFLVLLIILGLFLIPICYSLFTNLGEVKSDTLDRIISMLILLLVVLSLIFLVIFQVTTYYFTNEKIIIKILFKKVHDIQWKDIKQISYAMVLGGRGLNKVYYLDDGSGKKIIKLFQKNKYMPCFPSNKKTEYLLRKYCPQELYQTIQERKILKQET